MQEQGFQRARCAKDISFICFHTFGCAYYVSRSEITLSANFPKIVFNGLICQVFWELFIPKYLDIFIYKKNELKKKKRDKVLSYFICVYMWNKLSFWWKKKKEEIRLKYMSWIFLFYAYILLDQPTFQLFPKGHNIKQSCFSLSLPFFSFPKIP